MVNHFSETAQRLREIAATAAHISNEHKMDLRSAANTLTRLEQLKHDLLLCKMDTDCEAERLALELLSLLGIQHGS